MPSSSTLVDSGQAPRFLLLPGVEYTTYWGHANGIGATEWVDDKTELPPNSILAAAQQFHDQGALFSINHPSLNLGDACIGCAWAQDLTPEQVDGVEIATGFLGLVNFEAIDFWDDICLTGRHAAALGGSDDHRAGKDLTALQRPIGTPTTMVYASELSVKGIMDGIRNGRTVVRFEGMSDPMVELDVEREPGTAIPCTPRAPRSGRPSLAEWAIRSKSSRTVTSGTPSKSPRIPSCTSLP